MDSEVNFTQKQLNSGFTFGHWQVFPEQNTIKSTQTGDVYTLVPKVMELLLHLVENAGQVCEFEQLHQQLWPQEFVNDNALYNLIGQLRKVLGDKASNPAFIATVSKKGYRFIADVHLIEQQVEKIEQSPAGNRQRPMLLSTVVFIAVILTWLFSDTTEKASDTPPSLALQQYALAEFQLNQGNISLAQQHVKQALAIHPDYDDALILDAFANWNLWLNEEDKRKAQIYQNRLASGLALISEHSSRPEDVKVLAFLTSLPTAKQLSDNKAIQPLLVGASQRSIASIAQLQFKHGLSQQAESLLGMALKSCPQCPYLYNLLARSQSVSGKSASAFENFQQYLLLTNNNNKSLDKASFGALNYRRLRETANWLANNPYEEITDTAHRNTLVLFNLSLQKRDKAKALMNMTESASEQGFFTLYTQAALTGAYGNFVDAQQWLWLRHQQFPDNNRFFVSTLFADWLANQPEKSLKSLNTRIRHNNIQLNADTLGLFVLKAALMSETGELSQAKLLLDELEPRYEQYALPTAIDGSIEYAQLLAISGKKPGCTG